MTGVRSDTDGSDSREPAVAAPESGAPATAPMLFALDPEQARRSAAHAGWEVAEVVVTAPPRFALVGPLRVVGQRVSAPRVLCLIAAAGIPLECQCGK